MKTVYGAIITPMAGRCEWKKRPVGVIMLNFTPLWVDEMLKLALIGFELGLFWVKLALFWLYWL